MNVSNYGSSAYQSQMDRYKEAIEKRKQEREARANGPATVKKMLSFSDILVLGENGEVTGRLGSETGEYEKDVPEARTVSGFDPDMPTINILDLFDKSQAECLKQLWAQNSRPVSELSAGEKYLRDLADYRANPQNWKYPIADFTAKRELVLTGDEANDRSILAGFAYQKSCLDTAGAKYFLAMTEAEDFTGMSHEEIYNAIYSKYQFCYGEHFLDIRAVDFIRPPEPDDDIYREIVSRFENEVLTACGTDDETVLFDLRKNALYPDMSDEEIRQTIIDSYTDRLGYDMTNADLCKMAEEISLCGIGHGIRNMFNTNGNPEIYGSQSDLPDAARQSAWLNKKASAATFDQVYKMYQDKLYNGSFIDPEVGGVIMQMKNSVCPPLTYYR